MEYDVGLLVFTSSVQARCWIRFWNL